MQEFNDLGLIVVGMVLGVFVAGGIKEAFAQVLLSHWFQKRMEVRAEKAAALAAAVRRARDVTLVE